MKIPQLFWMKKAEGFYLNGSEKTENPATTGVSVKTKSLDTVVFIWSEWRDSNSRPHAPKARTLPTAPHPDFLTAKIVYNKLALHASIFLCITHFLSPKPHP